MNYVPAVEQFVIAICGLFGILLSLAPELRVRRFGCILGLLSQPAWLHVSWVNAQWGMFLLAMGYTLAWGWGVWIYWVRP